MSTSANFLHELVGSLSQGAAGNPSVAIIVADVIGNPPRTRFIREAEARGCRTLDGLGMLVYQGVICVRYWTGLEPDPAVMQRALRTALGL